MRTPSPLSFMVDLSNPEGFSTPNQSTTKLLKNRGTTGFERLRWGRWVALVLNWTIIFDYYRYPPVLYMVEDD